MPKTQQSRLPSSITHMPRALIYARVSSKEQDREGFSIDAQLKLLRTYAEENGIRVIEEYVDVETAKVTGRTRFTAMVGYIRRHPTVNTILVEKTDRLYRNLRDWVTIDEFDIDVHLVKEGVVLSQDSRSSEKFMHGIKVLMAKNYIDNLSEEARKGMIEKAEQGIWPTQAPLGYRNVVGPNGKKIIEVDPIAGPTVTHLFEWYSTGLYSLKEVSKKVRAAGLVYRKSLKPVALTTVNKMLRSRIYTGEFEWLGKRYQGTHEPLISVELWERVQGILDGRHTKRSTGVEKDFLFSGLIHCGHCGCLLVGDIKKQKYIYYRCSHAKQKCPEPYVREEVLIEQFTAILGQVSLNKTMLGWLTRALRESNHDVKADHERAMTLLETELADLRQRMKELYRDRQERKVDDPIFRLLYADYQEEERKITRELETRADSQLEYLDEGVVLLHAAKDAKRLFERSDLAAKRHLLSTLLSNFSYSGHALTASFRKPFDIVVENLPHDEASPSGQFAKMPKSPRWLPE